MENGKWGCVGAMFPHNSLFFFDIEIKLQDT
jgi:hypothetical protein